MFRAPAVCHNIARQISSRHFSSHVNRLGLVSLPRKAGPIVEQGNGETFSMPYINSLNLLSSLWNMPSSPREKNALVLGPGKTTFEYEGQIYQYSAHSLELKMVLAKQKVSLTHVDLNSQVLDQAKGIPVFCLLPEVPLDSLGHEYRELDAYMRSFLNYSGDCSRILVRSLPRFVEIGEAQYPKIGKSVYGVKQGCFSPIQEESVVGDVACLKLGSEVLDYIFAIRVFNYSFIDIFQNNQIMSKYPPQMRQIMARYIQALKPGGKLYLDSRSISFLMPSEKDSADGLDRYIISRNGTVAPNTTSINTDLKSLETYFYDVYRMRVEIAFLEHPSFCENAAIYKFTKLQDTFYL